MIRLKELRLEKGLNQKEFAEMVDTTQRNVSNWENGNSEPDIQMLLKMSKFFDVSVDYFLGNTENLVKIETANSLNDELFSVISKLPTNKKRALLLILQDDYI
ncbi:MAG: helix-turn-helix transcriptional regulator [Clostridia bacterium]|nr:helix-turn-helix transcriptional regulator [Clostridia bacterium]